MDRAVSESPEDRLAAAAKAGDADAVRALLAESVGLERADAEGMTPLLVAAKYQRPEVVQLLLDAGADLSARDRHDYDAAALARYYGEDRMGHWTPASKQIEAMLSRHPPAVD